jgi:hypothetical protein
LTPAEARRANRAASEQAANEVGVARTQRRLLQRGRANVANPAVANFDATSFARLGCSAVSSCTGVSTLMMRGVRFVKAAVDARAV